MSIKDRIKAAVYILFGRAEKIDTMNPKPVPVDPRKKEK